MQAIFQTVVTKNAVEFSRVSGLHLRWLFTVGPYGLFEDQIHIRLARSKSLVSSLVLPISPFSTLRP
jgi:hypothetical protein